MNAKVFLVLLTLSLVGGCTSMKPVHDISTPQAILKKIQVGDLVNVETNSGEKVRFIVESIDEQTIKGEGVDISMMNIARIETKQISIVKTSGLTIAIAVPLIGVATVIYVLSLI